MAIADNEQDLPTFPSGTRLLCNRSATMGMWRSLEGGLVPPGTVSRCYASFSTVNESFFGVKFIFYG